MSDSFPTAMKDHYSANNLLQRILDALRKAGKPLDQLTPDDLAAVDHFHTRGRQSTEELAALASELGSIHELKILDVGCGIGGTARFLASRFKCNVAGVDQSQDYIQAASGLSELVGLEDHTSFVEGSATQLPFDSSSFDIVWTEHAQMNIADKQNLYKEIARVLKPGGRFVFHDVFAGTEEGQLTFPVPWADQSTISHLISQSAFKQLLDNNGLDLTGWYLKTPESRAAFSEMLERMNRQVVDKSQQPLGLHFLMGSDTRLKVANYLDGLQSGIITVAMGVAERLPN